MTDRNERWDRLGERLEDRVYGVADRASRAGFGTVLKVGCLLFVLSMGLSAAGGVWWWIKSTAHEAVQVAHDEIGPAALNAKYKWFKDTLAALDAKRATLHQWEGKGKRLESQYAGTPRNQWARADLSSLNQWATETDAMVASYNDLAAEYNAAMAKFHTAFVNAGKVPAGGDASLPREVREYIREMP